MTTSFEEYPPQEQLVTDYDRAHFQLYLDLLDARSAKWTVPKIAIVLFGIDAHREAARARQVIARHLKRALWMTKQGYRHLLAGDQMKPANEA